jgi:hypothetical protein
VTILLDNGDEFGVPAKSTRVYPAAERSWSFPRPLRMASRKNALDRHTRYRYRQQLARELAK